MPVTVKKSGVFKPTTQPHTKVAGSWRPAKKVYLKKSGAWQEVWPRYPNAPQNPSINSSYDGTKVVLNASWSAPAGGGFPYDRYITQLVFRDPQGNLYPQGYVAHTTGTLSFTSLGQGNSSGWQHVAGWTVKIQAWSGHNATETIAEYWSVIAESGYAPVIQLPVPPAPTGLTTSMASCALTTSWTHAGSPALTGFEIQIWQWGYAATTYTVGPSVRSYAGQPWDPTTVGRHGVSIQVRAKGTGGDSAWVSTSGVMPGPLSASSVHYNAGTLYVLLSGNYEGFHTWRDYWGRPSWEYQNTYPANDGSAFWHSDTASSGYATDNSTQRRFVLQPYNSSNGWTGRYQGTGYAIKIPNPVYIEASDCNTWWSIPIPGKWRTNPQADDWFYQGKSISGNSYGCLFYRTTVMDYFASSRIGYTPTVASWWVLIQRTYTGGLVAAINLNIWLHNRQADDIAAAPGLTDGPQNGPSMARNQIAFIGLSTSWWPNMASGAARGIAFYVDPGAADNQLRSEIGNVSNRYMILNKPHYGATYNHGGADRKCGTIVVYHSG